MGSGVDHLLKSKRHFIKYYFFSLESDNFDAGVMNKVALFVISSLIV